METEQMPDEEEDAVRFEDLTVDDDLPIIERVVRYTSSQIALQRLVHVKMLAETAELAGIPATQKVLIPMLDNLLQDGEAVIRQHIAGQLIHLAVVAMVEMDDTKKLQDYLDHPEYEKQYNEEGYQLVCNSIISYLNELITDPEVDVRRAASDSLSAVALQLRPDDVPTYCLPIPLRLALEKPDHPVGKKRTEAEQRMEELRTTACNCLAELGGAASEHPQLRLASQPWIRGQVLPAILDLCADDSFRVRRSAAQALPRILGACTIQDARQQILPVFERLSQDEIHRVRKSTGECLVDMSRALMILAAASETDAEERTKLHELRQKVLLPIADRLIQDSHKQVRQGMMQFLGPFMASFYPFQYSALNSVLPASVESDGSHHMGIVAQFFPHASSMVARLNSSQNAISGTPTPVHSSLEIFMVPKLSEMDKLQKMLPEFIHAARMSALSLTAVTSDRKSNPPDPGDLSALADVLLDYFAALSVVSTGDENTDAEMRVYCAYSFPALVLLLGPENWEGSMKTCFFTLLNPSYGQEEASTDAVTEPPLPVKRCLASSLHTVAHILGPDLAARDVMPAVQEYFLPDADDSVRLNMIRNFGALLSILPVDKRAEPFCAWSRIVQGENFLGGRKRSATNPLVLNWRQRNYLARSLPEIISYITPSLLHEHLWPILQILLTDSIDDVRDEALWSVVPLMTACCAETIQRWNDNDISDPQKFSTDVCNEIVDWIVNNILISPQGVCSRPPNFTDRQVYCRICGSAGLALRLSEEGLSSERKDPVSVLSDKLKSLFVNEAKNPEQSGPYQSLTAAEQKHLKRLLLTELLPPALEMKQDRTSNVRITLMKVLQVMPFEIRITPEVKPVLKALEEESETWFSFGGDEILTSQADEARAPSSSGGTERPSGTGPVDVDNVTITPASSRDEGDEDNGAAASGEEEAPISNAKSLMTGGTRSVTFQDGPIGMQLEPTKNDKACRIYGFNDFGPGKQSPAQASGIVEIGDIIVSVNGVAVQSYDETIDLLKAGGVRVVVLRKGSEDERYISDDNVASSSDEDAGAEDEKKREKKAKKDAKKAKKSKKKSKSDDSSTATHSDNEGDSDGEKSNASSRSTKSKKKPKRSKSEVKVEATIAEESGDSSDNDESAHAKKKDKKKSKSEDANASGDEPSDKHSKRHKSKKAVKADDATVSDGDADSDNDSKKAKKEAKKAKKAKEVKESKKAKKESKKKK